MSTSKAMFVGTQRHIYVDMAGELLQDIVFHDFQSNVYKHNMCNT